VPAEARIECPHAPPCPGCPLIGLPLAAQLAAKAERVARALAPFPRLRDARPEPVRGAEAVVGYRTRAKLAVAPGPRLGLFAGGAAHEVLDLPGCRVLSPALAAAAAALRRLLAGPGAGRALCAEGEGGGRLRAVDLREVQDAQGTGLLVTLVLRAPAPSEAELAAAAERLAKALPALRGVALALHDGRSPQLLGGRPRPILGPPWHRDAAGPGAVYALASHGAFTQVHRSQAEALREEVARAIGDPRGRRVLELYGGSGALSLGLAAAGARVVMVEAFAPAAEAARRAAREQGLRGLEVHAGPAESELAQLRARRALRFDAAVANPPRRGIPPRAREVLAELCAGPLVYVSCEPATLARDLAHLAELGWSPERIAPFDLIPQSAEVECLALLRRGPPPPPLLLYQDEALLAFEKPPFLPSVPHPERAGSLLARVRELPGAERAVPLHRLDAGTSGVCLFAREAAGAAALARALAAPRGRRTYLALVRGVPRPRGRIARALREGGRDLPAATRYRRLRLVGGHALLEVAPESGRTHQIRRHLAAIGSPVLGDSRHGHAPSNRHLFERHFLDRPFLHCAAIELPRPGGGEALRIESPLAPDLAGVLGRLESLPGRAG
jgi:23S rRNA (uracil1939-C5)-methyltransferase